MPMLVGIMLLCVPGAQAAPATNDPGLDRQWAVPMVHAPEAWAVGTGAGATIAVIDTGVDLTHEDLKDKVVPGKNFVDPTKPPQDDHGHGTHVAGIAAASTNNGRGIAGIAPDARIMPIKVLDAEGKGDTSDLEAAITYAADQGAAVINLSLGDAPKKDGPRIPTPILGPSFANAVNYAWDHGSICVIAAGNTGDDSYVTSSNFRTVNAIVVTALGPDTAKPAYASPVRSAKWGLAAPGGAGVEGHPEDDILSAWWVPDKSAYAFAAGTSMATPHVSAAAAILRSLGLDKQQTVDRLLATARDLGAQGRDDVYGAGALDVAAAVAGLRPATGTTTTTTTKSTTTTSGGGRRTTTTTTTTTAPLAGAGATPTSSSTTSPTAGQGDGSLAPLQIVTPADTREDGRPRPWAMLALATVLLGVVARAGLVQAARPRLKPG
jgi:subtilisin family serine protease